MRRTGGRVLPIILLVALGVALWSVALGPQFDGPDRYDGDGDDTGLIANLLSQWVGVIDTTGLTFVPLARGRCPTRTTTARPPQISRAPLCARAPPA